MDGEGITTGEATTAEGNNDLQGGTAVLDLPGCALGETPREAPEPAEPNVFQRGEAESRPSPSFSVPALAGRGQ